MQKSLTLALRLLDTLESDQLHRNQYSNRPRNTSTLQKQTTQQHAAQSIGIYSFTKSVSQTPHLILAFGFKKFCATSR